MDAYRGWASVVILIVVIAAATAAAGTTVAAGSFTAGNGVSGTDAPPSNAVGMGLQQGTHEEHVFVQDDESQAEPDDDEDGNETPRHHNPEEYEGSGDPSGLQGWFSDRLVDRLQGSTVALSEGQYDLAREHVGEEYQELAGKYAEVSGEAGGEDRSDSFEAAREEQARLAETVEEYYEVRAEYEAAREAGNDLEARQHARRLIELANEIEESSERVDERYDELGEETEQDLSASQDNVATVNRSVQEDQAEVSAQQFFETRLELSTERETISFLEPLNATGELRAADGTAVGNEEIRLEIGGQTEYVETDSTGAFELEHRPRDLPLDADELTVEFVPENQSSYLGSETTLTVSTEQVTPTITTLTATESGAYGDTISVEGALYVDDVPVDGVPLSVHLGEDRLGTVDVTDGSFEEEFLLPRSISAGEHDLRVALELEDRALAPTAETTRVTVLETRTTLSAEASMIDGDVRLSGVLETEDGEGLENESVEVALDGTTIATVSTGEDGEIDETIGDLPPADGESTLTVAYDDPTSNLASSEAATTVRFSEPGDDAPERFSAIPTWALVALGLLGATAVVAGSWWHRRPSGPLSERPENPNSSANPRELRAHRDPDLIRTLLTRSRQALARDRPDLAVQLSYAAARRSLDEGQQDGALTHWEFFERFDGQPKTGADDRKASQLYELTAGYERATFDDEAVDRGVAETLLEYATRLCDADEESDTTVVD